MNRNELRFSSLGAFLFSLVCLSSCSDDSINTISVFEDIARIIPDSNATIEIYLDESDFFSDGCIRSLSKIHEQQPYYINIKGQQFGLK